YSASTAALARTSPCKAFAISDLIKARCLLTRRALPSSRTVICSLNSAARSVASFKLPLRRPFGLPDFPRLNWPDFGGLPYPILYSLIVGLPSAASCSNEWEKRRARPAALPYRQRLDPSRRAEPVHRRFFANGELRHRH